MRNRLATCAFALSLSLTLSAAGAHAGTVWELLAIDGVVVDSAATLERGADGSLSGKAPCNSWSAANQAEWPALRLSGIRATRMACDGLAAEQAFFAALAGMTQAQPSADGRSLVLTGPDGHSMEFADDLHSTLTRCRTCAKAD